jgi:hypothetical protein
MTEVRPTFSGDGHPRLRADAAALQLVGKVISTPVELGVTQDAPLARTAVACGVAAAWAENRSGR